MRIRLLVCVLAIIHVTVIAACTAQELASPTQVVQRFTLSNGLRVWHLPRVESDSVVVVLSMHVGSSNETAENNGISHFLEHMLFAETEKYPKGEVMDVIERHGGVFNGQTLNQKTIYYAVLGSRDFTTAAEWISQVVFHPTLPADRVERERNVIFQEMGGKTAWYARDLGKHGYGDDVGSKFREILFPQSASALPVIGTDKPLSHITADDLRSYYQHHYAPNNAVLIVVGNVSAQAVRDVCDKFFGEVKPHPCDAAPAAQNPPPLPPREAVKLRAPTAHRQCTLMVGARTVNLGNPDWWPVEVLATYLQLAVQKEARLQEGLAYSIDVTNAGYSNTGVFSLSTQCAKKNLNTLRAIVDRQLDALRCDTVDSDRLGEAKTLLLGKRALALESNMNNASWLEQLSNFYRDDQPLPDYRKRVEEVTAKDLARVTQTYLASSKTATVEHVPLY